MRVAINCRSFLTKRPTGIGRYAYHLVKSLTEIDHDNEYRLYANGGLFNFRKRLPGFNARNFIPRHDWFCRGPAAVVRDADVYHMPSPGPWEAPPGVPTVVTVHDVIFKAFPQGHTPQTIEAGERQFADIKAKAAKIICCSRNTADDLQSYLRVPREKITLVYQGIDKGIFHPIDAGERPAADQTLRSCGIDGPYLLSVGTIEPRKNLVNVLRAFHRLKAKERFNGKLVVVGMQGWLHSDVGKVVDQLALAAEVIFLGYVTDRVLRHLYNRAEVFVFPSFYEGFGFPIVEAFSCGAPVVTSNVSSCPEIAGDAALTVDPGSEVEIAGAVERLLHDAALRADLVRRGKRRAEDFDFRKTARQMLEIYKEVYRN